MVTIKQKSTVNTQKIKIKESKHTSIENHQIAKKEKKKGTEELQNNQKIITMMAISIYLLITILNVHRINFPVITRCRVAEWIKTQDPAMCFL